MHGIHGQLPSGKTIIADLFPSSALAGAGIILLLHRFPIPMKFLFDLLPVILFFAAYKTSGIFAATAVAIAATAAQIAWVWYRHRKVDTMLWASLAIVTIFGGATLLLHDETFIKWKPTVLYWLFSTLLLGSSIFFRKNLIRTMLGKQITLPEPIWHKLNLAWSLFFVVMGLANLYVAFTYSLDAWVNFKLFGATGMLLAFMVAQGFILARYMDDSAQQPAPLNPANAAPSADAGVEERQ